MAKVVKALAKAGFKVVNQKGSHILLADGKHKITVPRHDPSKRHTSLNYTTGRNNKTRIFLDLFKAKR